MTSQTIVGLDIATKAGFCIMSEADPAIYESGEMSFKNNGIHRVNDFYEWITDLMQNLQPSFVMVEGYGYGNAFTLATLVEIGTAVRLALHRTATPTYIVPPTVLKKFVTGSGAAKKDQMMLQIFKRWGAEFTNNNEADAYALARMARAYTKLDPVTKEQETLMKKVSPCT